MFWALYVNSDNYKEGNVIVSSMEKSVSKLLSAGKASVVPYMYASTSLPVLPVNTSLPVLSKATNFYFYVSRHPRAHGFEIWVTKTKQKINTIMYIIAQYALPITAPELPEV